MQDPSGTFVWARRHATSASGQDAWHLLWFSSIALVVAVGLNWRNGVRSWWINLVIISAVDVGFIVFVLILGHVPLWPGLAGPMFWILGLIPSSLALQRERIRYDNALSSAGNRTAPT